MFKKVALLSGVLVLSGFTVFNVFSNVKKVNAAAPCIITISGVQYDVAPLQVAGVHPGGNVFVCGTDMTTLFMSMPTHAADIARMTPYIYVAPTAVPTIVPTIAPTVSPVPSVVPTVTPVHSIMPTVTPIPSVTVTPSPSVSPTPHHDDDKNEVEEHKDEHKNENHETKTRGKSQEHASEQGIASRNENSQHKDN